MQQLVVNLELTNNAVIFFAFFSNICHVLLSEYEGQIIFVQLVIFWLLDYSILLKNDALFHESITLHYLELILIW